MRSALLPLATWLLAAAGAAAAPIRITAWDLALPNRTSASATATLTEDRLNDIAATLRGLAPDVIFLRGVPHPSSAEKLIASLRPQVYRLILCSSLATSPGSDGGARLTAVLSREPAFGFQAVEWAKVGISNLPGGFVFAGFRYGKEPVCLYGLQFGDGSAGPAEGTPDQSWARQLDLCSKYLSRHMSWVEQKLTNQAVGLVVASQPGNRSSRTGETDLGPLLAKRGFQPLTRKRESGGPINVTGQTASTAGWSEETLVRNLVVSGQPRLGRPPAMGRVPVTLDLAVGSGVERTEVVGGAAPGFWGALFSGGRIAWLVAGAVALILVPSIYWRLRWHRREEDASEELAPISGRPTFTVFERGVPVPLDPDLPGVRETPDTEVSLWQDRARRAEREAEQATSILRQGLVSHLADWMKQKIVVGLLSQRNTLLDSNRNGSVHLTELEGRLGRIQEQFQERLYVQQQRIAELEQELAAKERLIQQFRQSRV